MTLSITIPTAFDQRTLDAYGCADQAALEAKLEALIRKRCCDVETDGEITSARSTVDTDYNTNWT